MPAKKRVDYLDVAKGIAILSVVVGHTFSAYDPGSLMNKFIYSFHMPLFFLLSGYFYRQQEFKPALIKKVKNLLVPYLVVNGARCLAGLIKYGFSATVLTNYFFPALYGNGSTPKIELSLFDVKIVGMTWFLIAMFFCQVIYLCLDEFARKYEIPMWMLVLAVAFAGIGLNDKVWLPFSLQPAMGALMFYHVGRLMREKKVLEEDMREMPVGALALGLLFWLLAICYQTVGMHANSYKSAVAVLGAITGTYFIVQLSKPLYRLPAVGPFLNWCGKYSLYIYGFHAMDAFVLVPIKKVVLNFIGLPSTKGALLFSAIRLCVVLLGAFLFVLVKRYAAKLRSKSTR